MDDEEKRQRHREWLRDKSLNGGEPFDGRYTTGEDLLLQRLRFLYGQRNKKPKGDQP